MTPQEARDLAQKLAGRGIPTFPLGLSWNHEERAVDKKPLSSSIAKNGFYDASTDPQRVEEMFLKARLGPRQEWGVGVYPGPAGYIVLDVDVKKNGTGPEDLDRLTEELGPLPEAMRVDTASGGFHLWLKRPSQPNHIGNEKIAAGIDIRCDGGYVVAPGTSTPWGEWMRDTATSRLDGVGQLPEAWADRLYARREDGTREPISETLTAGNRYPSLLRLAGAMRRQGATDEEILAALRVMNQRRCVPPHEDVVLEKLAEDIASRYEPDPDPLDTDPPEPEDVEFVTGPAHPGGAWIFDQPDKVGSIWGSGDEVAWPEGEAFMIAGSDGSGKTVLAGNLVVRMTGLVTTPLLGMPVIERGRILYLAQDRPKQAARAFKRLVGTIDRATLDDRLKVIDWPIGMLDEDPGSLLALAKDNGADTVIVDAVKDILSEPSTDRSGQAMKVAYATCIAAGVECALLHHDRKAAQDSKRRLLRLSDVYGSRWMVAGCGSVVALNGSSGDPVIELRQLKQPSAEVGPIKVSFDFDTGEVSIFEGGDLYSLLLLQPEGLTAYDAARLLYETDKPTNAERERARRKLKDLAKRGMVFEKEGSHSEPARWWVHA